MKFAALVARGLAKRSSIRSQHFHMCGRDRRTFWINHFSRHLTGLRVAESDRSNRINGNLLRSLAGIHVLSPNLVGVVAESLVGAAFPNEYLRSPVHSQVLNPGVRGEGRGGKRTAGSLPALFDRDAALANETLGLRNAKTVCVRN